MKQFFATMNFVRLVMLLCLFSAVALGYLSNEAMARKAELQDQVQGENSEAAKVVQRIQQLSVELDQLLDVSAGASYEELQDAEVYARDLAARSDVNLGQVQIGKPVTKPSVAGAVDKTWSIDPKDSRRSFPRANISNYLYILEVDNPFVIVTECEFRPTGKSKDHEYADDRWTFKAKITSRLAAE